MNLALLSIFLALPVLAQLQDTSINRDCPNADCREGTAPTADSNVSLMVYAEGAVIHIDYRDPSKKCLIDATALTVKLEGGATTEQCLVDFARAYVNMTGFMKARADREAKVLSDYFEAGHQRDARADAQRKKSAEAKK